MVYFFSPTEIKNDSSHLPLIWGASSLHFFKGFSLYKTSTVDETAEWLIYTADKIEREFGKGRIPYYLTQTFAGTLCLREQEDTDTPKEEPSGSNYCSVVKKVKKEEYFPFFCKLFMMLSIALQLTKQLSHHLLK